MTKNGCSATCSQIITSCTAPSCSIIGTTVCGLGGTTSICGPSGTGYTYLWNNGSTSKCRTVFAGAYTVTVTNSGGCSSSCSVNVSAHRMMQTDATEENDNLQVTAYPNPFSNSATIEFHNPGEESHIVVELYSLAGNKIATLFDRNVSQDVSYKVEVNAENLLKGIYIYRIANGDKVINRKLILIK